MRSTRCYRGGKPSTRRPRFLVKSTRRLKNEMRNRIHPKQKLNLPTPKDSSLQLPSSNATSHSDPPSYINQSRVSFLNKSRRNRLRSRGFVRVLPKNRPKMVNNRKRKSQWNLATIIKNTISLAEVLTTYRAPLVKLFFSVSSFFHLFKKKKPL